MQTTLCSDVFFFLINSVVQDCETCCVSLDIDHLRLTHPWSYLSSSSAAFLTQTVCLDDTTVKFEIWDTAGQERYHSLAPMYYRGAQAAIVVYDITNEARLFSPDWIMHACPGMTFTGADAARSESVLQQTASCTSDTMCALYRRCLLTDAPVSFLQQESFARAKSWVKELQRQASPNIVIALSGNKADLANKRAVDFQVRANKPCLHRPFYLPLLRSAFRLLLMNTFVLLWCRTYLCAVVLCL